MVMSWSMVYRGGSDKTSTGGQSMGILLEESTLKGSTKSNQLFWWRLSLVEIRLFIQEQQRLGYHYETDNDTRDAQYR